ncbi:putative helicase senataxin [Trichonephila clavata]|uniref:Putative helicase senataxin n=1 Tax=Trichonephila clavata TaxID=2740835 RepID=A0A8X6KFC9_TRICU|nr:putative helicase senataxin [Trichonephila clavata]
MEYFLRQIEKGNSNPLNIILNSNQHLIGSDSFPILKQYPEVLPRHAQFNRRANKWYVKCLQKSGKIYLNGCFLHPNRMYEVKIGDHVEFGDANLKSKRFLCSLSVKPIDTIDLLTDDLPNFKKEQGDHGSVTIKTETTDGHSVLGATHIGINRTLSSLNNTSVKQEGKDILSFMKPDGSSKSKAQDPKIWILDNTKASYSETEEVITISDDEAYLDFNSEVVTIELSDDDDDWNSPEFCKSSTSNKSVNKENSFINEINLSSKNLSELDQNLREDVEISDFNKHVESDILVHQRQLRQNDKLYPTSESATSNSKITNLTTENLEFVNNHDHTTNSFEDHLSNSSVSSHDEIIIPFSKKNNSVNMSDKSKEFGTSNEIASTFSDKNELNIKNIKSETQPIGRTLYTEPKRIVHRPKRMRGREEWFKEQNVPVPSPSSSKELPKDKSSSKYSKKDKQGTKRTKRKQIYKKGKVSHTSKKWSDSMVIGALTKESPLASFKIPKKLPSDKPPALAVNKEISKPTKTNQTSSLNKKIPSITRKPDKYASRSAFLITEMSTKEKNSVSRKLIPSPSIQATNVNNSNNVKHNLPFDVNTKKIIKKPVANVRSLNVNDSNTKVPSVISNSDQMEGEPCTQKYVKTRDNLHFNTNTTCNDTLSGMSEKVPVADSSLPGNKNSPLNQELLFSNKSEQLCDKNTSLMPLKTNFKPNKNGESLLNHQISKINPITDNKDKKSNNLIVSATFSDVMTEASNKRFEYKEVTSIIKRVVEWKDKWLKEQQTMSKPHQSSLMEFGLYLSISIPLITMFHHFLKCFCWNYGKSISKFKTNLER